VSPIERHFNFLLYDWKLEDEFAMKTWPYKRGDLSWWRTME